MFLRKRELIIVRVSSTKRKIYVFFCAWCIENCFDGILGKGVEQHHANDSCVFFGCAVETVGGSYFFMPLPLPKLQGGSNLSCGGLGGIFFI